MSADAPVVEIFVRSFIATSILGIASYTVGMLHYHGRRVSKTVARGAGAVAGLAFGLSLTAGWTPVILVIVVSLISAAGTAFIFPIFLRAQDAFRHQLGMDPDDNEGDRDG